MKIDWNKVGRCALNVGISAAVEMFIGAATNKIIENHKGGKIAKYGTKAGGYLVGAYVGNKVTDGICDSVEEILMQMGCTRKELQDAKLIEGD